MNKVVVAIISKKNTHGQEEYLLVASKSDFGAFTGFYYPPAGHVEKGEDEVAALKRELNEELGLIITSAHKLAETPGDIENQWTLWYACDVGSFDLRIDSEEIVDARFVTRAQMTTMNIWPATKKFFQQYIN